MESDIRRNSRLRVFIPIAFLAIMVILFCLNQNLEYPFFVFVILTYVVMLPRKILNPKNIVFAFYFIWYCVAPAFSERYKGMVYRFGLNRVNIAFLMCFISYITIMITLEVSLCNIEENSNAKNDEDQLMPLMMKVALWLLYAFGLSIYISRTGGISFWMTNPGEAFFRRGGSGMFYLLFTNTLFILLYFEGQKSLIYTRDYIRRIFYIVFLAVNYLFIGSKSTTFMALLLLFSNYVLTLNILSIGSIVMMILGALIFVIGMFVRMGTDVMYDFSSSISTMLKYFDTFENLLIVLRDFEPGFMKTFLLPLNWPLVKLGITRFSEFFDMSVWLTTIYYPESYLNGGTIQWPVEVDIYLSFYFIGGIPILVAYFVLIGYAYKRAQNKSIWRFIYICEGFFILSHLRGGLLIYWYYWLVPLYFILLMRYDDEFSLKIKGLFNRGAG